MRLQFKPSSVLIGALAAVSISLLSGGNEAPSGDGDRFDHVTAEHLEILNHMSIVLLPDGAGGEVKTIRISDVNVQIVNGMRRTGTVNGLGNFIIGYNDLQGTRRLRTGSHNLILGIDNSYGSYGGLVAGSRNHILAPFASVRGGIENTADGYAASICGGEDNVASGGVSSVSGGNTNTASGEWSSVSGGTLNEAAGESCSVSGGRRNVADGTWSSVSAGIGNTASGHACSVTGGGENLAETGGATVHGGWRNAATDFFSSVSGGRERSVAGWGSWGAGSLFEEE